MVALLGFVVVFVSSSIMQNWVFREEMEAMKIEMAVT